MANMGYCRFTNTLGDLRDCYDHMEDVTEGSTEETRARTYLVRLCKRIAEEYEDAFED